MNVVGIDSESHLSTGIMPEKLSSERGTSQNFTVKKDGKGNTSTITNAGSETERNTLENEFDVDNNSSTGDHFEHAGLGNGIHNVERNFFDEQEDIKKSSKQKAENVKDDVQENVSDDVEDLLQDTRITELVYREFSLRTRSEDSGEISSIAVTSYQCHMIVCDHMNGHINLMDKQFNLVFKYQSCFKPWSAAVLDGSFFVVTFPLVRMMQYFKFKDSYSKFAHWFPVKAQNEYYGVCGNNDRIVTVCKYDGDNHRDTPAVHILNRQGLVINIIMKDNEGRQLFVDPEHIAMNNATKAVYVSDMGAHAVICINLAGDVLCMFRSRNFSPTGLAVDDSRSLIFVNDLFSESVISFSQTLEPMQKIKAQKETIGGLLAATYCLKSDRLIVSMKDSMYLKTFTV